MSAETSKFERKPLSFDEDVADKAKLKNLSRSPQDAAGDAARLCVRFDFADAARKRRLSAAHGARACSGGK